MDACMDALPTVQGRFNDFVDGVQATHVMERDFEASLVALCAVAGENPLLMTTSPTDTPPSPRPATEAPRGTCSLREPEFDAIRRLLPGVEVASLHAISTSSGETLNSLLRLLEDHEYDVGAVAEPCPVLSVIGVSDELPHLEDDNMQALADRFVVRLVIDTPTGLPTPVTSVGVSAGAGADAPPPTPIVATVPSPYAGLLTQAVQRAVKTEARASVLVTDPVADAVLKFKDSFLADNKADFLRFSVSDRRWFKVLNFLRLASWCRHKTLLCITDAFILVHCLWREWGDFEAVRLKWFESFEGCMRAVKDSEITDETSKWQLDDVRGASTATVRWLRPEDVELLHRFEADPEGTVNFLRQVLERSHGRAGGSGEATPVLRWVEAARRFKDTE